MLMHDQLHLEVIQFIHEEAHSACYRLSTDSKPPITRKKVKTKKVHPKSNFFSVKIQYASAHKQRTDACHSKENKNVIIVD